jgi:phage tail-like protein
MVATAATLEMRGNGASPPSAPGRGTVDGLVSPRPIGEGLPAIYQDDELCMQLTSAFDEMLAPIFATLDCLHCYLDPRLAPEDFVEWLAGWVGVEIDQSWTLERLRELVLRMASIFRIRGTKAGLVEHVALYCGSEPEIDESGACTWSQTSGSPMPGSSQAWLEVTVHSDQAGQLNRSTLERIVAASRPAHVPFEVQVVVEEGPPTGDGRAGGEGDDRRQEAAATGVGGAPATGTLEDGAPERPAASPDGGDAAAPGPEEMADPNAPGAVSPPGSESIELAPPEAQVDEEDEAFEEGGAQSPGEAEPPE